MGSELTSGGWSFSKRTKTTAEIILDFYKAIRAGAHDAIIIGCNTVGHLCAGLFEVQRTGDDTSGQDWERTRRMGINTLAFRAAQHDAFFQVDADCVGVTSLVPWDLNKNWLDLLSKSGTPLFASIEPNALGPQQKAALKEAFSIASQRQPLVEPLDWLDTTCPTDWRLGEKVVHYNWYPESGISAVAGV
jgi:alpha-galactosidase